MTVTVVKKKGKADALPEKTAKERNRERLRQARANRLLRSLGERKLQEIEVEISQGKPILQIAKMIQDDWGELVEVKLATLSKAVQRLKETRIDGKLLYLQQSEYGKRVFGEYSDQVDILENHQRLIRMQQERVSKAYVMERPTTFLNMELRKEIMALAELYRGLMEMQMELGLIRRAPKEIIGSVEVAASRAQEAMEEAIAGNAKVEKALAAAFNVLEGEFKEIARGK